MSDNAYNEDFLEEAEAIIRNGNLSMFKGLEDRYPTIDISESRFADGANLLMLAADCGNIGVFKYLWTKCQDNSIFSETDDVGNNILHYVFLDYGISNADVKNEMIGLLRNHGYADSLIKQENVFGQTPISTALSSSDDPNIIESLLENYVDPKEQDSNGKTALHYLAQNDNRNVVAGLEHFIKYYNLDTDTQDIEGQTPDQLTNNIEIIRPIVKVRRMRRMFRLLAEASNEMQVAANLGTALIR